MKRRTRQGEVTSLLGGLAQPVPVTPPCCSTHDRLRCQGRVFYVHRSEAQSLDRRSGRSRRRVLAGRAKRPDYLLQILPREAGWAPFAIGVGDASKPGGALRGGVQRCLAVPVVAEGKPPAGATLVALRFGASREYGASSRRFDGSMLYPSRQKSDFGLNTMIS